MVDLSWVARPFEIGAIDLLLGADNALVIALACRSLPPASRGVAMSLGAGAAILLRFVLTAVAGLALGVPGLGMLGGTLLLGIAIRLALPEQDEACAREGTGIADAVVLIVVADVVMSLDNVLALAAVAQGQWLWLLLGLALSVPVVISGSAVLVWLLGRYPGLVLAGSALLGWLAGGLIASDALIANWVAVQAPALAVMLPLAGAAYVVGQVRIANAAPRRPAALAWQGAPVRSPAVAAPRPPAQRPVTATPSRVASPPLPASELPAAEEPAGVEHRWLVLIFGILFAVVGLVLGGVIYISDQLGM